MTSVFQDPIFQDENKAREALEAVRWPEGPICPHCGNSHQERIAKIEGTKKTYRPDLYYCYECKGQFIVTVGTVFEREFEHSQRSKARAVPTASSASKPAAGTTPSSAKRVVPPWEDDEEDRPDPVG